MLSNCYLELLQLREYIDDTEDYINIQVTYSLNLLCQIPSWVAYQYCVIWIKLCFRSLTIIEISWFRCSNLPVLCITYIRAFFSFPDDISKSWNVLVLVLVFYIIFCSMAAVGALSKFRNRLFIHLFFSCWNIWHEYPIYLE